MEINEVINLLESDHTDKVGRAIEKLHLINIGQTTNQTV